MEAPGSVHPVVSEDSQSSTILTSLSGSYKDENTEDGESKPLVWVPWLSHGGAGPLTQVAGPQCMCSQHYTTLCPRAKHWGPGDLELFGEFKTTKAGKVPEETLIRLRLMTDPFHFPVRRLSPHTETWSSCRDLGNFSEAPWAEARSSWRYLLSPTHLGCEQTSGQLLLLAVPRLSGKRITVLLVF